MKRIFKKIILKENSDYQVNILLEESHRLLGNFETDETADNVNTGSSILYTITGETSERLFEVRTFSKNQPYKIGVNGVTNITYLPDNKLDKVFYSIDGIDYVTQVSNNNFTTFSYNTYGLTQFNSINKPVFKKDKMFNINDEVNVESLIYVDRGEKTCFDDNFRLNGINNIDDLINYAGGTYFNIFT